MTLVSVHGSMFWPKLQSFSNPGSRDALSPFHHQRPKSIQNRFIMAPGQKLYPRATVKKIVKAHSNRNVSKNVDVMVRRRAPTTRKEAWPNLRPLQVFLDYVLFMQSYGTLPPWPLTVYGNPGSRY
jgi:hypothetical protein